jgi:hypothetical protein
MSVTGSMQQAINYEMTVYHVRLINSNKNMATVVKTFRRNVFTIVSNLPDMILYLSSSLSLSSGGS